MHDPYAAFEDTLRDAVEDALAALGAEDPSVRVETPPDPDLGDLSVPCHPFASALQTAPAEIAGDVADRIEPDGPVGQIEAEGPYVNAFVDPSWLAEATLSAIDDAGDAYGRHPSRARRVILEHTSANPTGPFHVGRARNPIVGDTLARILDAAGWDVRTEYYVNDVGKQAAILAWGADAIDEEDLPAPDRDKPDHRWVRIYQAANERLEDEQKAEEAVARILQALERADEDQIDRVRDVAGQVLDGMRQTLDRLRVPVDNWVWESAFLRDRSVDRVVEALLASDRCQEEDGAHYIDLEPFGIAGDDPRFVFTRADGTSLYTTRDVAYHLDKIARVGPGGRLVTVLGEDHKLQSRMLTVALSLLLDDAERTEDALRTSDGTEYRPVFYAFVSLPEGSMSTRAGRVVYVDDLLDEAVSRAEDEVRARRDDLPDDEVGRIAETVGVGAVRFHIVHVQPEKAMTFRWDEALSFDGDAAPFVQYSHARAAGILRKAADDGHEPTVDPDRLPDDARPLVKTLARFPGVVADAADEQKPHAVSGYALDLARTFNGFYRDVPVLQAPTDADAAARLALVDAARQTLANALGLLGIAAPEEM